MLHIRHAEMADLDTIMEIYATARRFMASTGNPNQWGPTEWPPRELIEQDIATHKGYVCTSDDRVVGVFYFDMGTDIEPTYQRIEDGAWVGDETYGVVHRIASDGTTPGVGTFCLNWAYERAGHVRIDTHGDNRVMQGLLRKLGFAPCGIIHVQEDNYPRIAFEKL